MVVVSDTAWDRAALLVTHKGMMKASSTYAHVICESSRQEDAAWRDGGERATQDSHDEYVL